MDPPIQTLFHRNTVYVYQISLLYCIVSHFIGLHCAALASTMLFILQFFLHLPSPCTLLLDIARYKSFFEIEQSAKRSTLSQKIVLFLIFYPGEGVTPNISLCEEFEPRIIFYGLQVYEKEGLFTSWSMWKSREILVLCMTVIEMFETDDTMILNFCILS